MSQLFIPFPSSPTNHSRDVNAEQSGEHRSFRTVTQRLKRHLRIPVMHSGSILAHASGVGEGQGCCLALVNRL